MSGSQALLDRLEEASDRLSPLLVKEVRQLASGREFHYAFHFALLVGLAVAFFGAADALTGDGTAGRWTFVALTGALALLGLVVVPLAAFGALRNERLEQTLELITLTSLSPRRVVVGKLLAQGVRLAMLFAGLAPFVAMSFLLGGVDFGTILVAMAVVFMWSLCASAACLALSSAVTSRAASGVVFGAIGLLMLLGLFVFGGRGIYFLMMRGSMGGVSAIGTGMPTSWWTLAVSTTFCAALIVNLVLLAENRLLLPSQNRSTALRLGFLAQLALMVAWTLPSMGSPASAWQAGQELLFWGAIHLALVATFTVTEDLTVPRRVRLARQDLPSWRRVLAPLQPGGGNGALYVLLQMACLLAVGQLLLTSHPWALSRFALACGYICFFTGVPVVAFRALRPYQPAAFRLRVAVLVLLAAAMTLPDILAYLLWQRNGLDLAFSVRHLLNPFRALSNLGQVDASYRVLAAGIGVTGVLAYVVLIRIAAGVVFDPEPSDPEPIDVGAADAAAGAPGRADVLDWSAVRAAARFRLAIPRSPIGGRLGERLGSGTGSSLEFQDYRPYMPGDDLRHVDWAAYARSETLAVRLYREEVAPRIDLIVDVSRSMAVTAGKRRAYGELLGVLAIACANTAGDMRLVTTAGAAHPVHAPEDIERFLDCDASHSAIEASHLPLRRRSLRVVVSDFLFPHDPDALVAWLARDCALLSVVQLTLRDEAEPAASGGHRLVDVEGHGELDLVLDAAAVADYRLRFSRLRLGLSVAARRAGARFAHVVAETSLRDAARALAAAGVLEAA